MNAFISRLKRYRLGQILGVFLASCLLFFSTACSGNAQAKTPTEPTTTPQVNNPAKSYDVRHSGSASGMNRYSDVDPRRDSLDAAAKTKGLIDNSKRNLSNRSGNVVENARRVADEGGDNLKELGRNAAREARELPSQARGAIDEASDRASSQINKVQRNLDEAKEQAKESARRTVD